MFASSFCRLITRTEFRIIRGASTADSRDIQISAAGCRRAATGNEPRWSRWQWVTMIRSRATSSSRSKSGRARFPESFGCSPASTRIRKGPSSTKSEFEPMPPEGFKSVSCMKQGLVLAGWRLVQVFDEDP